jgi:phosphoserine phosphatase RsbU/P
MNDQPIRILLVEDDPGDARLLREMLADAGTMRSELVWSTQLGEALQRLSAESFDVILLDLSLADSQGWGTFDKMHGHTTHVPIVVLTGLDDEAVAVRAMGEAAQDFLVKGHVDGQLLARAIRYAIERQQLATALIQTRQQQLEMKDQLLSHVSHEFRTPLMAILWYARNLLDGREGELTPEQHNALGVILRNAQQLGTMIGDLLESTQAQTGKLTIEPQCLSLVEVIPETLRTPEASAAAKQIRLSADVRGFLPPVYADADRVRQILINLIENAIKFTPEHGEVQVQASVYREIPAFMCVAVRDTGCGISPQGTHKIFERLYQEANASDAGRKGLGLGLYICYELVAAHRGHIWVESQLGQGSTFFFTLPVFPLVGLLSPIIKAHNWQIERLVLITIEFYFQRRSLPTLMRETLLRQAWQVLKNCSLHECLVLLPRMASLEEHELFFGVACVDQHGAEQIVQQIRARPEFSSNLVGPDVEIQISTMTIETPPESQEFPEALVNTIASRIEDLKHRAV